MTTRDLHRPSPTLGARLAAQLEQQKRRPRLHRIRASRPAPRRRRDSLVAEAERALEQSPIGREVLQLADERSHARLAEALGAMILGATRDTLKLLHERIGMLRRQGRYGEVDLAEGELRLAEAELRRCEKELAGYTHARELLEVEIQLMAEAVQR